MTYDLDTPQGLANSIKWTERLISSLSAKAVWAIPRSGTTVAIDKTTKTATITSLVPDPSVSQVLRAMGWTVIEGEEI